MQTIRKHVTILITASIVLLISWAIAEEGRTSAQIKTEVSTASYNRPGDLARADQTILLADIAANGPGSAATLTRTTAAKTANYTIATGFAHALVYLPSGAAATIDNIPMTGPATYVIPSNFPARHATALPITSVTGTIYVSETR